MTLEPTEMKDKPQKWGLDMWNVVARHRNKEDSRLRLITTKFRKDIEEGADAKDDS